MSHKPRKSRGPVVMLLGVPLLLALYVLSIGPAYRLVLEGMLPPGLYSLIYAPINLACGHSPRLDGALTWWVLVWNPDGIR